MTVTKEFQLPKAEELQKNQFMFKFNKPKELADPMPNLKNLIQTMVNEIGKEEFIQIQKSVLDKWAFRSGYSMEHKEESKLFEFTHVSLLPS